ncbi:ParB/RepB/Spo0J family partition protein [Gilvimarinus sp. F26214L]|uniref:ParB/RepB/Spo0J family partition protein n=1 Tax=Gilvimarinus sp. DZF01 TaxID=3461371 RepID=UPI004045AFA1
MKRKGLGKGLDALLGGIDNQPEAVSITPASENAGSQTSGGERELSHVPLDLIQRGKYQPRRDIQPEALEELAESIKAQGVMQPIVLRPISGERYEIIAGERRWRAAQLAGLERIPAVIKDVSDEAAIAMALIENIQREDLNPIEEAFALKRLQDEFELTHQEVAAAVGKSRTTVTNLLRLINLADEVKKLLEHGDLEMGHARALLSLEEAEQRELARQVVAKDLSVRQTEALVRRYQQQTTKAVPAEKVDPDIRKLEESLSEQIGVPVSLQHNAKGRGKLVLRYNSLDELDGILAHIK